MTVDFGRGIGCKMSSDDLGRIAWAEYKAGHRNGEGARVVYSTFGTVPTGSQITGEPHTYFPYEYSKGFKQGFGEDTLRRAGEQEARKSAEEDWSRMLARMNLR